MLLCSPRSCCPLSSRTGSSNRFPGPQLHILLALLQLTIGISPKESNSYSGKLSTPAARPLKLKRKPRKGDDPHTQKFSTGNRVSPKVDAICWCWIRMVGRSFGPSSSLCLRAHISFHSSCGWHFKNMHLYMNSKKFYSNKTWELLSIPKPELEKYNAGAFPTKAPKPFPSIISPKLPYGTSNFCKTPEACFLINQHLPTSDIFSFSSYLGLCLILSLHLKCLQLLPPPEPFPLLSQKWSLDSVCSLTHYCLGL